MSGHIWRGILTLLKRGRKEKPKAVRPRGFDLKADCKNSCGCRIPLKCFDKEACQYGAQS